MYSEIMNMFGLSQSSLEVFVLCAIGIGILGFVLFLYWKQIIIGAIGLSCIIVFANHKSPEKVVSTPEVSVQKKEEIINSKKEEVVTEQDDRSMFIEDCLEYTEYSRKQCIQIWNEREVESEKLKMKAQNRAKLKEYMTKTKS